MKLAYEARVSARARDDTPAACHLSKRAQECNQTAPGHSLNGALCSAVPSELSIPSSGLSSAAEFLAMSGWAPPPLPPATQRSDVAAPKGILKTAASVARVREAERMRNLTAACSEIVFKVLLIGHERSGKSSIMRSLGASTSNHSSTDEPGAAETMRLLAATYRGRPVLIHIWEVSFEAYLSAKARPNRLHLDIIFSGVHAVLLCFDAAAAAGVPGPSATRIAVAAAVQPLQTIDDCMDTLPSLLPGLEPCDVDRTRGGGGGGGAGSHSSWLRGGRSEPPEPPQRFPLYLLVHKADHHAWVANAPPGQSGDGRLALAAALSGARGQQGAPTRSSAAAAPASVAPPPTYACGLNAYDLREYAAAAGFRGWFWTSIYDGPQLLQQAAPSPQSGATAAAGSAGFKGFISSPLAGGGGGGSARLASSRSTVGLGFGRDSSSSAGSGVAPGAGSGGAGSGSPAGGGLQRTASMRAGSTAAGSSAGSADGGAGGFGAGFGTGTAATSGAFSGPGAAASTTSASLTRLLVELVDDMLEYWGFVEAQGEAGPLSLPLSPGAPAGALPSGGPVSVAGASPAARPGGPTSSARHSGASARDDRLLARSTGEDRGRHHDGKADDAADGSGLGGPPGIRVPWVAASVAACMHEVPTSSLTHIAAALLTSPRGAPQPHTRF
jgi:hypothetical protein